MRVCVCMSTWLSRTRHPSFYSGAQLISCAYCRFLTYFCAFSAIFASIFLTIYDPGARSPPADGCSGYKHFELSYFQLSHIYLISLGLGWKGGSALCCSFIKWHVSLCSYMYLSKSIFMRGLCCSCCCCCYCCFTSLNPNPPSSQSRKGRDQVQVVEYLRVHRMRYTLYMACHTKL